MIVFDLKCDADHVFEAWFASSEAYEDQRRRGLIVCPWCQSVAVDKAVMAPRLSPSVGRDAPSAVAPAGPKAPATAPAVPVANHPSSPPDAAAIAQLLGALAKAQQAALENSSWVGRQFADRARAMHYGEEVHAAIHGEASPDEAKALIDEGVAVAPLPFPVVPPEAKN